MPNHRRSRKSNGAYPGGGRRRRQVTARTGAVVEALGEGVGGAEVAVRVPARAWAGRCAFRARERGTHAGIAGLVVVGTLASDFLPVVGTNLVPQRLGLAGRRQRRLGDSTLSLTPLVTGPLLLALADGFGAARSWLGTPTGSCEQHHRARRSGAEHRVVCHLDRPLIERKMTLTELAHRVGVTVVNLSILKNNRARAVRFSTLTAICDALHCQPGDVFSVPTTRDHDN